MGRGNMFLSGSIVVGGLIRGDIVVVVVVVVSINIDIVLDGVICWWWC